MKRELHLESRCARRSLRKRAREQSQSARRRGTLLARQNLGGRELAEHTLDESSGRLSVSGRIVGRLGDPDGLGDSVFEDDGEALGAAGAEDRGGSFGSHLEIERTSQERLGISEKRDHRSRDTLILGPRLHDREVVDAVNQNLIYPRLLQSILLCEVVGDILRGSGGREGAGQTDDHHFLASDHLVKGGADVGPLVDNLHRRRRIADADEATGHSGDGRSRRGKHKGARRSHHRQHTEATRHTREHLLLSLVKRE